MPNDSLINIKNDNAYIYHNIELKHLYKLFKSNENVLVRPSSWDDPFESLIMSSKVRLPNGKIGEFGFRDKFFAQCWTLHNASDAMWRLYSGHPDKDNVGTRVRIRTKIDELFSQTLTGFRDKDKVSCFIGKINYLKDIKLKCFVFK